MYISILVNVEPFQNFSYVLFQTRTSPNVDWDNIAIAETSNSGGSLVIPTNYTSLSGLEFRTVGIIGTNPYLMTIKNPNVSTTDSFGYSISLNDEWLVGSLESEARVRFLCIENRKQFELVTFPEFTVTI
jgi:hypothetical protein